MILKKSFKSLDLNTNLCLDSYSGSIFKEVLIIPAEDNVEIIPLLNRWLFHHAEDNGSWERNNWSDQGPIKITLIATVCKHLITGVY